MFLHISQQSTINIIWNYKETHEIIINFGNNLGNIF